MTASAIKAGEAFVRIWANDKEAQQTFNNVQSRMKSFAAEAAKLGAGMFGAGAAMTAPFAASLRTFTGFSDQMARVKAVSGATNAQFAQLNDTAKNLGATTSFTAKQVADGLGYLAMAGYNAEEAMAGIPAVLNLARAGSLDLGRAADIATDIGTAFGLSANEIGRVGDVLAKAATISNTNVEMMGESFQYAAAAAQGSGQTLEEMAASMAVLAGNGIKASMAGAGLRSMLTDLTNPSAKAQEVLDRLRITVKDNAGAMRPLLDIIQDFDAATSGMGQMARMSDVFSVFGDRGGTAATALMSATGQISDLRRELGDAGGTAESVAKVMDDTLGGSLRMFSSALEAVSIHVGETIAPTARWFIDAGTAITTMAGSLVKATPGAVKLAAGVAAVTLAIGAGALAMAGMAKASSGAIGVFQGYGRAISGAVSALSGKAAAERAAAAVTASLAAAQGEAEIAARRKSEAEHAAVAAISSLDAAYQKLATSEAKLENARYKAALATKSQSASSQQLASAAKRVEHAQASVARAEANVAQQRNALDAVTRRAKSATDEYAKAVTRLGYAELEAKSKSAATGVGIAAVASSARGAVSKVAGFAAGMTSAAGAVAILSGSVAAFSDNDMTRQIAMTTSAVASCISAVGLLSGGLAGVKAAAAGAIAALGGGLVVATGAVAAAGIALAGCIVHLSGQISAAEKDMMKAEGSAVALAAALKALNETKGQSGASTLAALEKEKQALVENTKEIEKQLALSMQAQALQRYGVAGAQGNTAGIKDAERKLAVQKEALKTIDEQIRLQKELNDKNKEAAGAGIERARAASSSIAPESAEAAATESDGRKQLLRIDPEGVKEGLESSLDSVATARKRLRDEQEALVTDLNHLEAAVTADGAGGTAEQRQMIAAIATRMEEIAAEDKALGDSLGPLREQMEEASKAVLEKQQTDSAKALEEFKKKSLSTVDASRQEAGDELIAAAARLDEAKKNLQFFAQGSMDGTIAMDADVLRTAAEQYDQAVAAFEAAQEKMAATDEGAETIAELRKELETLQRADANRSEDREFAKLTKVDPFKAAQTAAASLERASMEYSRTMMDFQNAINDGNAVEAERLREIVAAARAERDRAQEKVDGLESRESSSRNSESRGTFSAEAARRMSGGAGPVDVAKQQLEVEKQMRDKLDKISDKITSAGGLGA